MTASLGANIHERLVRVRARIAEAARSADRDPADVRLVAVSKTFSTDHVRAAAAAGQVDFGENKVQEGLQKIAASTDLVLKWHLIGHLQSNKARPAAESFACIHSVDSMDLVERLDRAAVDAGTFPEVLVQIDLAGEPTKHGAPPTGAGAIVEAAVRAKRLRLTGLMALPPYREDPEDVRPYFRRLREIRDQLRADGMDPSHLRELSMGMSHDYYIAVQEGSTMVRIGSAIFGPRR